MNKKIGGITNLFFGLIMLSGVIYTGLLLVGLKKILPGFSMNLIFLLDSLKYNNFGHNFNDLWQLPTFLTNILAGPILIGLTGRYLRALIKVTKEVNKTKKFINNLDIKRTTRQYDVFKSSLDLIFTGGLLRPKIFVSSKLFSSHTKEEIKAMLWHEQNHKNDYHPIKITVANLIKQFLPPLPGKNYLFDNYLTMTEVSSDQMAEAVMKDKKPIVSALLKFQRTNMQIGMSYFNSQSERIKILVGQKKQSWIMPITYSSLLIAVFFMGTASLKSSTIFYDCQHLIKCVELLVTPSTPVPTSSTAADHCQ